MISFERYQADVHPLTVRENITKRKTFVTVILIRVLTDILLISIHKLGDLGISSNLIG